MGKYMWGADKTIELLNAVQRWDQEIKETQPKGRGISKWQWVAAQLFVPDGEWDMYKLSKRCERRVALLRTNYETYCQQLTLVEESPIRSPPPIKFDADVWNKMKNIFGEPKIPSKPSTLAVGRAQTFKIKKTPKENQIDDDQDSEDEPAAIDHGQRQESLSSSSSSVGSNHSYHDSAVVFSPTTSFRCSYCRISSSDGHAKYSDGLDQTTAIAAGIALNNQPFRSGHDSSSDFSQYSKTSLHNETSSSWESSSKDSDSATHDQTRSIASKYLFCSVPETAPSNANYRSLIEDLNSLSPFPKALIPSAAAAVGSVSPAALPAEESDNRSPGSKSSSTSKESKSCSLCCSCGKYYPAFNSFVGSSSGKKSTCQPMPLSAGDRKHNSVSSDSSMSRDGGSEGGVKERTFVMAAAAAGYRGLAARGPSGSEHSRSSSSEAPRDVVVYNSHLNVPQHLQLLPASSASLSLNGYHPEHDDHHPVLLSDDDLKTLSSKGTSKEDLHDRESGNRIVSSSSGSSSPTSFLGTVPSGKDDNVNLMVYIKLNNLKLSEGG